jgi:hypothetical protein
VPFGGKPLGVDTQFWENLSELRKATKAQKKNCTGGRARPRIMDCAKFCAAQPVKPLYFLESNWQPAMWVVKKIKKPGGGTRVVEVIHSKKRMAVPDN